MKQKPKSVAFKIVFSHTMITVLLILVQLALFFGIFFYLGSYSTVILVFLNLLGVITLLYLINKDDMPEFKLAWAIPICLLPVFGTLLFLFVDHNFGSKNHKRQLRKQIKKSEEYLQRSDKTQQQLNRLPRRAQAMFDYVQKIGGYPAYDGGEVTYFPMGKDKWEDLLEELEEAREFIFLEYFIVEQGEMWDSVLEILKKKVKEGVEVRVMYDGMCSIRMLPRRYPKTLRSYGIKAKVFAPILPLLSTHQNNRDHRKILVIDGRVAYNGGVNFADEYIGRKIRFGKWKDTAIKISGRAVDSFTVMFLQMWNINESAKKQEYAKYLKKINDSEVREKQGFIMPYGDGPHQKENVAENIYMDMLYTAEKYVHIMTPYFIVDKELLDAMKYAAKRGVDVKVILPHIPDKKVAFALARNNYPKLLEAGIQVYEYMPGFMHAKVFSSDDKKAIVGTINLDYRSLYHHFECATYIYDNPVVTDIERDFSKTLLECRQVDMAYYKKIPAKLRALGWIMNFFGPLM